MSIKRQAELLYPFNISRFQQYSLKVNSPTSRRTYANSGKFLAAGPSSSEHFSPSSPREIAAPLPKKFLPRRTSEPASRLSF